ncbi:MAG TPA: hypothetical protein VNS53_02205 [Sphingomicrobium sp.]|nr:hypothetical protein [Sphingomicrobium sp.]
MVKRLAGWGRRGIAEDPQYYRERAAAVRKLAKTAPNAEAAAVYAELAKKYEALANKARSPA